MVRGGTLVLTTEENRRDVRKLLRHLVDAAVERLFLPPVVLQQLAEAPVDPMLIPTTVREIITAGEQLQITQHIVSLFTRLDDCILRNQYRPSESHVVTELILTGPANGWLALPPIGRPITNTQIYLLDAYLQPVPIGVPGELYIGGASLARGYLNHPVLTAEKIVPDPFSDKPGVRLYKTGDLARYRADGNIEFLGRIDNQVKIRGFRIELGEIEAVLTQYPTVLETVVVAREGMLGDKRLVAYIVHQHEQAPTITELRNFLREKLPEYMIPSIFLLLPALPFTPNGKIDRRVFPALDQARHNLDHAFVAPRTPVELVLATLWSEVLGLKRVGVHDNLFELGGTLFWPLKSFLE